jgi:energy-coupling factor transporter transmembrane protein EcfT
MEKKYYPLSSVENSKVVKIIQVIFGVLCFAVAGYWLYFNLRSLKTDSTLWITIIFLAGFGFYQIWSGLGQATRFIEISTEKIRLKKTVLLPFAEFTKEEIEKIDIFPFNLTFFLKSGKKSILRLSSSYYETNAAIKDGIIDFAEVNSISFELKEEKI